MVTEKNKIKREFIYFLKDNKALKEYKMNSYKFKTHNPKRDWERYISPIEFPYDDFKYGLIDHAFKWASTPQGHKYWQKLNDKWYEKLNKKL